MSDPSGWWVILGVLGVGGLGLTIAYASAVWRRRRKNQLTQQAKDQATHELYREEERQRVQREEERLRRDWGEESR
jgi:hypothetical protein